MDWAVANILLLSLLCSKCSTFSVIGETSLRSELLTNYSTDVRPTQVTEVQIAFNILSVQEMNIRNQQLAFAGWFTLVWVDPRLSWTPSSYQGVEDIHADDDHIWYPVLVVDNSVDDLSPIEDDSIPMRVTHDGTVRWAPPKIVTTSCDMDPTYFPFDKHVCDIQVTSFGYTLGEVNLTIKGDGMITDFYQRNGQWELTSHSAIKTEFNHDNHPYSRVQLRLSMKRMPGYHGINLLLPVIINSILVPFVFKVSPESGEKIGFTLTVLLAYMVILTLLAEVVPSTSVYTSLMEIYVSVILVLSTAATVLTVLIQNCFHRPVTTTVPTWLVIITSFMASCMCWKTDRVKTCTAERPQPPVSTLIGPGKTPIGWETDSTSSMVPRAIFDWVEISHILDAFCFWFFFICIVILTLISLILLGTM